jgi:hypothetical protein
MGTFRGQSRHGVAGRVVVGVLLVGGLVVGVPAGELLGAGLFGRVALLVGLALPGFGQRALGAGEVVGGFVG